MHIFVALDKIFDDSYQGFHENAKILIKSSRVFTLGAVVFDSYNALVKSLVMELN